MTGVQTCALPIYNPKPIKIEKELWNGRAFSAEVVLPPLAVCVFKIS